MNIILGIFNLCTIIFSSWVISIWLVKKGINCKRAIDVNFLIGMLSVNISTHTLAIYHLAQFLIK